MNYPNIKQILETDDFVRLRQMDIITDGETQQVVLKFDLHPRKWYGMKEAPDRLFLTNGSEQRFLYIEK